jgi:hypothetical protein
MHACEIHAYETHAEMHAYEILVHEMHAHKIHTREMYIREIYAHRSMAFLGGYGGAGVAKGCPRTAVFTLASDDDVDSLQQTQYTPLTLTTDRMQPFYSVVRTYLRLLIVAGLVSHFSFWR